MMRVGLDRFAALKRLRPQHSVRPVDSGEAQYHRLGQPRVQQALGETAELLESLHDQTVAPVAALQRGAQGSFVYAVNADSTVSMRTVQTGITDHQTVQILSGLKPGAVVVTDGADRLVTDADGVALFGFDSGGQVTGYRRG